MTTTSGLLRVLRVTRLLVALALLAAPGCASKAPPARSTAGTALQSRVVAIALEHVGAPYARGGATPAGFDCSGLVMYVYGRLGIALPHEAAKQYRLGSPVPRNKLQPGDLVFFDRLGHSGIYIGNARFVHATKPGDVVKVSRLDEDWYRRRWVGARRVL